MLPLSHLRASDSAEVHVAKVGHRVGVALRSCALKLPHGLLCALSMESGSRAWNLVRLQGS